MENTKINKSIFWGYFFKLGERKFCLKGDKVLMKKIEEDVRVVKIEKNYKICIVIYYNSCYSNYTEGNPFIDFMNEAFPWVLLNL